MDNDMKGAVYGIRCGEKWLWVGMTNNPQRRKREMKRKYPDGEFVQFTEGMDTVQWWKRIKELRPEGNRRWRWDGLRPKWEIGKWNRKSIWERIFGGNKK
jgi:hypothetical protein